MEGIQALEWTYGFPLACRVEPRFLDRLAIKYNRVVFSYNCMTITVQTLSSDLLGVALAKGIWNGVAGRRAQASVRRDEWGVGTNFMGSASSQRSRKQLVIQREIRLLFF